LSTGDVRVPAVTVDERMTAERLTELRSVLAALADHPVATLEVHPLPDKVDLSRGIPLDAASPLAQHLSQLITQSARSPSVAATATAAGEGLYRMVVPAKVAAEFSQGIVRPMASKAAAGGFHGALMNSTGIAAQATFVPVAGATAVGAVGGPTVVVGARVVTVCPMVVATAVDVVTAGAVVDVDVPADSDEESLPPQAVRMTAIRPSQRRAGIVVAAGAAIRLRAFSC
jgi:hypothetical protein